MSITRHHNEWLSLVPNSGPFLSLPVLAQAFPQGLDVHDADHARRLRMAFDEWDDNQLGKRPDPGLHRAWMKFVLAETLGYDDLLAEGQAIPQTLKSEVAEYGETLRPDWIVNDPTTKKARLLVQVFPRSQSLTKPVAASRWKTSPDTRMMQLLHDTGIRLGIVTNGDHWMLVNAPRNETTGYVSWYANLWLEEKDTLRAFRTLLGADRLFSVPENETLEALLDKSANDQQEVTDQLGYQVRKAVEVLIQALDKADQEHGRKLLGDVNEKVLYESALTVMMRLVFLFCAEERELLLLGDDLYDKNYAVSTLREQLRVTADQFGEEILGLRYDAWTRLLTTFRAVYAGAKHDRLKLPAYGGSLFNPDRFPFLEGRKLGTNWKNAEEVEKGLHEKKKPKPAPKPKTKPATAKIQPSLFDNDGTFPRPGLEDYLCGLVCDLIEADPGLPVSAYVDSLVVALGYERHQRLLTGKDRTAFAKLCKASPLASWSSTDRIPWGELQNLLIRRKAINPEGQTLQTAAALTQIRNSYPAAAPELIALLRKAAAELRVLQVQATATGSTVLEESRHTEASR